MRTLDTRILEYLKTYGDRSLREIYLGVRRTYLEEFISSTPKTLDQFLSMLLTVWMYNFLRQARVEQELHKLGVKAYVQSTTRFRATWRTPDPSLWFISDQGIKFLNKSPEEACSQAA